MAKFSEVPIGEDFFRKGKKLRKSGRSEALSVGKHVVRVLQIPHDEEVEYTLKGSDAQ